MLIGQSPKVKGNICNIPITEMESNCKSFPTFADSDGIIIVKLKRKNNFRGHVLLEPVKLRIIERFLNCLKLNNPLYRDVEITLENLLEGYPNLQMKFQKTTFTINCKKCDTATRDNY